MTIKELINILNKVKCREGKNTSVYFETNDSTYSIEEFYIDNDGDLILEYGEEV